MVCIWTRAAKTVNRNIIVTIERVVFLRQADDALIVHWRAWNEQLPQHSSQIA